MHTRYYVQVQDQGEHWETFDAYTTYAAAYETIKHWSATKPDKIWRILESKPTLTELDRMGGAQ